MANHHLTIAKATFAASLLRPDFTKVSREELPQFHALLETATIQCSPANIQKCKQWLVDNILPSSKRTSAFARYLTIFVKHAHHGEHCSSARQRLHVLYLLNDLLHHAQYHTSGSIMPSNLVQAFQPSLVELVRQTAADQKKKTTKRLKALLSLWLDAGYFGINFLSRMQQVIDDPNANLTEESSAEASHATKELPYIMPAFHGDPSLPFHELPAGNYMPHIIPNKAVAMRPDSVRALQLAAGPADEGLVNAVKDFLKDVEAIDDEYNLLDDPNIAAEVDEMGQVSYKNEAGDVVGSTYYGWSRAFCEKMKSRNQPDSAVGRKRNVSRSSSMSRSRSRSPRKRRRYSASTARSVSDRSDSRSPPRRAIGFRPASRSRSNSPPQERPPSFTPSNMAPSPVPSIYRPPPQTRAPQQSQISAQIGQTSSIPVGFPPNFHPPPIPPSGMPIPPPRPLNWQGPWPPPPPPPPPAGIGSNFPPPNFNPNGQNGYNQGPPSAPQGGFRQYR